MNFIGLLSVNSDDRLEISSCCIGCQKIAVSFPITKTQSSLNAAASHFCVPFSNTLPVLFHCSLAISNGFLNFIICLPAATIVVPSLLIDVLPVELDNRYRLIHLYPVTSFRIEPLIYTMSS